MNVDTGELKRIQGLTDQEVDSEIKELAEDGFTPVPKKLEKEARKELKNQQSTIVNMEKKTPLTEWAKDVKKSKVKQGRNEYCACKSGKKYKHCHGR